MARAKNSVQAEAAQLERRMRDEDLYAAYCGGYARGAQHNEAARMILPADIDCPRTLCAFSLGLKHGLDGEHLCNLRDVVSAVGAYFV